MQRWLALVLLVLAALPASGCATAVSALLGAALCGDSDTCRGDMIASGVEADAEMIASAVASAADADTERRSPSYISDAPTSGGEEYEPPDDTSAYYHCVDGEGHHVLELVAPSELDARMLCAAQQGVTWNEAEAGHLCTCSSRG
ncbi:MAG: hypothetical protein H6719_30220 [Sandaracinaceae bacterium]|nr:hypothetical protein [Sandaracinaceae bacterium]